MSDQQITCAECGNVFPFSAAEQQFYTERGLASPPKRCKACRQARRASQGGGGGDRGMSRDRGPHHTGNPNEYRSPMSTGNGYGRGGGGGLAPRGDRPGGYANGPPRGGDRSDRAGPRGFGRGGGGGFNAGGFNGGSRPTGGGFNGGSRPAGGGFSGGPRPAGRGAPRESSWGTQPGEGGPQPPRAQRGKEQPTPQPNGGERAERAPRARAERPRYDITCAECGTQAQVPFKPLDGRQVFCQPCYRARKGTPATEEAATNPEKDAGIVE